MVSRVGAGNRNELSDVIGLAVVSRQIGHYGVALLTLSINILS